MNLESLGLCHSIRDQALKQQEIGGPPLEDLPRTAPFSSEVLRPEAAS